jgi:tight adherence protein B
MGFFSVWWTIGQLATAIVLSFVLGSIPLIIVERKRRKRFEAFRRQLPDALTMMKNSLQAGHTLDKAMQVISQEMPDPIALEFRETVEELHLGLPVKRAMENFSNRIIDENLNIFVAALLVQREIGGNLTELLGNLAHTIRERFRIDQEVHTLTAEGRISGYVIGSLPIVLAIIINMMQPDYLKPLFETETGVLLLKGAVVMNILGFYCIRRVCRVNY